MKITYNYASSLGTLECLTPSGEKVIIPVVPGILKHPAPEMLPTLLAKPDVVYKYSIAALQKAAWPILRLFPDKWLRQCIPAARLPPGREKALRFLLSS